MQQFDRAQMERGFAALGITSADIQRVMGPATSLEECQKRLDELKEKAKASFKKQAVLLHPDVNGGDAEKTELFRIVCHVRDEIESLQIRPVQPMPQVMFIQIVHQSHGPPTTTGPAAGTTTHIPGFWGFGRPPPGHPSSNGRFRRPIPTPVKTAAVEAVTASPSGVNPRRGS